MNKNLIESLDTNTIECFRLLDDKTKVIMTLKDGSEVELFFKNGFDIIRFYDLLNRIAGKNFAKTIHTTAEGFFCEAQHAMMLKGIRSILQAKGEDVDPEDIHSIMLDGFKGRNLVTEAKDTGDMEQAVLTALDRYKELGGKVGAVYDD